MYKALDVAKYIVSKCKQDGTPISNQQLQKILFCIQRDFLRDGRIAFQDNIEAWQFGAVVPDVYYYYCGYGVMPIVYTEGFNEISENDCYIIDNIVENKRALYPWEIAADTNKSGGAWERIYDNGKGNRCVIPVNLIKKWG